jgi:pyruvate-ferredoxin/flavodoxin oxidoreductase
LSIFGDHSDVMAVRQTDSHCSRRPRSRAPRPGTRRAGGHAGDPGTVLHFFDGFRTSHELNTIETLPTTTCGRWCPRSWWAHRGRALSPERPFIRGTAQNRRLLPGLER